MNGGSRIRRASGGVGAASEEAHGALLRGAGLVAAAWAVTAATKVEPRARSWRWLRGDAGGQSDARGAASAERPDGVGGVPAKIFEVDP